MSLNPFHNLTVSGFAEPIFKSRAVTDYYAECPLGRHLRAAVPKCGLLTCRSISLPATASDQLMTRRHPAGPPRAGSE